MRKIFCLAIALLFSVFNNANFLALTKFSVGVVPHFTSQIIFQSWAPLLNELSSRSGYTFELRIKESIPGLKEAF